MLLREASATTSSAGNRRSARMLSISRPTLPVAPTTATLKPIELSEKRCQKAANQPGAPAFKRKSLITQRCPAAGIYDFFG